MSQSIPEGEHKSEERAEDIWERQPLPEARDKQVTKHFPVLITNNRRQSLKAQIRFTSSDIRVDIFERTDPREDLMDLMPARTYKVEPVP